jgi:hypothetical protein
MLFMVTIFPPDGRNPIDGIKAAGMGFRIHIAKDKTHSTKD